MVLSKFYNAIWAIKKIGLMAQPDGELGLNYKVYVM